MANIKARVDRALPNSKWKNIYPNTLVEHWYTTFSYHHALFLDTEGVNIGPQHKIIAWLENTWIQEFACASVVYQT